MAQNVWEDRIVGHGEEAPEDLVAHPSNWRIHPRQQQDVLAGAIKDVGFIRSVTVNRRLTISELKRAATFPDSFQLLGSYKEQWARIGNSVPPNFMRAIAEHIHDEILAKTPILARS